MTERRILILSAAGALAALRYLANELDVAVC